MSPLNLTFNPRQEKLWTYNYEDGAHFDVSAQGFWGDQHECAFFDVRVFNCFVASNCRASLSNLHVMRISKREAMSTEIEKLNMAHSHSASGGMALAATTTLWRMASLISNKHYNKTIAWIRCLLSFSLVRFSVMCLRGAQSSYHRPAKPDAALSEGHVPTYWTINSLNGPLLSFISSHSYIWFVQYQLHW